MNVAEAKVVGAEFIAGVPDNKYTLSDAVAGIDVPETLQENYNSFNFENFKDSTKIPFKGRNANIADVIQEEDTVKPFEQITEEAKPTQVAEKAVTERRERVDKGLETVRSIATETQIEETRKAVQEDSRFRRADEIEIDEEVVKRLKPVRKKLTLDKKPVQEFFDGCDVIAEADNKTRVLKADDTNVKFSVSSLFSSPTDEAIKSLSDLIVEEKTITGIGGENETGI